jgi:ATP-dependent Clp protease adaptor protein ClpS
VLYGLLHSEPIAAAVAEIGGDTDKLVDGVLDALDRAEPNPNGERVVAYAAAVARSRQRQASCADLWSAMTSNGASPIDGGAVTMTGVLFVLAHGTRELPPGDHTGVVEVLLHNDDFTHMEAVVAILREVFELDEPHALTLMREAHHSGRATIGRLPGAIATRRIAAAHARARADGYPLWIEAR